MLERLISLFINGSGTLTLLGKTILILIFFVVAWFTYRLSNRIGRRIIRLGRFTPRRRQLRPERLFSRGRFSIVKVTLKLAAENLSDAIPILEEMANDAVVQLPNLLEPWQVLSESGVVGQNTELTLVAKARFGHGAEMRPRLLALVQEKLTEENIHLVN